MFRSKKHKIKTLEVNRYWLERLELLNLTSQMISSDESDEESDEEAL